MWKGQAKNVGLGSAQPVVVAVPAGQSANIVSQAVAQDGKIIAPLTAGQPLGTFTASLNGQPLATVPLTPLQDVPLAGFFGRLWDAFLMLFSR